MSLSQTRLFDRKYVTIATDISADDIYKICTWACYIRWDGGVIKYAAPFKEYPASTGEAETLALCNALVIAESRISDWGVSRVIIHNELEDVISPFYPKRKKIRDKRAIRNEAIINVALPILDKCASYDRRKITAHFKDWKTAENPKKYAINRWCDIESRRLLRDIRITMKKEQNICDFS
jgi:hypothetical protein